MLQASHGDATPNGIGITPAESAHPPAAGAVLAPRAPDPFESASPTFCARAPLDPAAPRRHDGPLAGGLFAFSRAALLTAGLRKDRPIHSQFSSGAAGLWLGRPESEQGRGAEYAAAPHTNQVHNAPPACSHHGGHLHGSRQPAPAQPRPGP